MSSAVEKIPYSPIKTIAELQERGLDGVGCVVGVVNQQGWIYVINEVSKGLGLNLPSEKRREGEFIFDNVAGALVEEMGVEAADLGEFEYVRGMSYVGRAWFPHGGLRVHGDVVLLYYTGERQVFGSRNEVEGRGFMDPVVLAERDDLRRAVLPGLELLNQKGVIPRLLAAIQDGEGELIFDSLNPEVFLQEREMKSDLFVG